MRNRFSTVQVFVWLSIFSLTKHKYLFLVTSHLLVSHLYLQYETLVVVVDTTGRHYQLLVEQSLISLVH